MKNKRPWILWLVVGANDRVYVLAPLAQRDTRGGFEMQKFGRLPVLLNGRIKPLDTVARNSLLIIHGKQTLAREHGELTPIDWLAEVMLKPAEADRAEDFRHSQPGDAARRSGATAERRNIFPFATSRRICRRSSSRPSSRRR